jgi:hypothetical protein
MSSRNADPLHNLYDLLPDEIVDPGISAAERNRRLKDILAKNGVPVNRALVSMAGSFLRRLGKKKQTPANHGYVDDDELEEYQSVPLDIYTVLRHMLHLVPVDQQRETVSRLAEELNPASGVKQGFFRSLWAGYRAARGKAT